MSKRKGSISIRDHTAKQVGYVAELEYYEKIHAHRVFQYAMSRYKLMRYSPENVKDTRLTW